MGLSNLTFFNTSNIKEVERQLQNKNNEKEEIPLPEATVENKEASKSDEKDKGNEYLEAGKSDAKFQGDVKGVDNVGQYKNDGLEKSTENTKQPEANNMEKSVVDPGPQGAKSVVAPPDSKKNSRKRRGNA